MFRRDFLSKVTFGLYAGSILGPKNLASINNDKSLRDMLEESKTLKFWGTDIYYDADPQIYKNLCKYLGLLVIPLNKMEGTTDLDKYHILIGEVKSCLIASKNSDNKYNKSFNDIKSAIFIEGNSCRVIAYAKPSDGVAITSQINNDKSVEQGYYESDIDGFFENGE